MADKISSIFSYEPKSVEVFGNQMQYVEIGQGDPILFLHGNPTSSYLWRNVMPHLASLGRCIAPDLIGMGGSDKPKIGYRVAEHADYLQGFIAALSLNKITLVLHDWGGYIGLACAAQQPDKMKALAFMEAVIVPMRMQDRTERFQKIFSMMRGPEGRQKVMEENFFVDRVLPGSVLRKLTDEEMENYRAPFPTEESRLPTYVFPNEVPLDGQPADVHQALRAHGEKVAAQNLPMLLLTFEPGAIISEYEITQAQKVFSTLQVKPMGAGSHFVQEDQPDAIGVALAEWLTMQPGRVATGWQ